MTGGLLFATHHLATPRGQCGANLLIPSYKEIRDRRLKRGESAAALAPDLLLQTAREGWIRAGSGIPALSTGEWPSAAFGYRTLAPSAPMDVLTKV
jgi:hypothetical protein